MKTFIFLFVLMTFYGCHNEPNLPNIVFILADDLGTDQVSSYGNAYYETPNIDRLSEEGMLFQQAYTAAAICSPTRASIMTGKHPARLHLTNYLVGSSPKNKPLLVPDNWQKFLPLEEITIAEMLKTAGYETALFGKWHLSKEKIPPKSISHNPDKQGFDASFVTYKPIRSMKRAWQEPENDAHNIDTISKLGIDFMKRKLKKPFFLMLSHNAIHDPLVSKSELIKKYEQKDQNNKPENHPIIASMVQELDNSVGDILNTIQELGISDNTLVIFYSDNGGKDAYAFQKPFRKGKGWLYEGGIRVPLIVRWPRKIKPGTTSDAMISSVDFMQSFMELVGVVPDEENKLDGISMIPAFKQEGLKREKLFWHYPHYHKGSGMVPASAMRWKNYKLIEWHEQMLKNEKGQIELYDLSNDIGEQVSLVDEKPEIATAMREELHKWYKEVGAQFPSINENNKIFK